MKKIILLTLTLGFSMLTLNAQKGKAKAKSTSTEYALNSGTTSVLWTGTKVGGQHTGAIKVSEGSLTLNGSTITKGNIVIDMNSITCTDIENAEYNGKLIGHLKADDFFGTDKYPTATLAITKATLVKDNNYKVVGNLTIKGKTHPIAFNSTINNVDGKLTATSKIKVNRTKFGIKYGSGLIGTAQDKLIHDDFTLDITLEANKK